MKQIRLDFTQDNPCLDGHILGHIGEHNATELIITPPIEFAENEVVKSYIIVFVTGGKSIPSESFDKTETLTVALWQQLTLNPVLGVQLEAYDDEGEFIGKSEYVTGLRFLASADGKSTEADTDNQSFVSMVLKTKHSHENKEILDKFSEDKDGNPLYDGQKIEGSDGTGLTDEQTEALAANTEARHTHDNKETVLDFFGLNYLGNRPTFKANGSAIVNILATQDDVISRVTDLKNSIGSPLTAKISLFVPGTGEENVIYLVPNDNGTYDEYLFINGVAELIGSTDIDLSGYAKTTEVEEKIDNISAYDIPYTNEMLSKSGYPFDNVGDGIDATIEAFNTYIHVVIEPSIAENTKVRHTHDNQSILDKISENADGTPLFNGESLKGEKGDVGEDGQDGADGLSAYRIWLNAGNTGTEADFLASLKGADGEDGAKGENGADGAAGADGTSVTVASVSESTEDGGSNVVTFSDGKTLTIKNGSKGSQGEKGDTGVTGVAGKDGADGYTPVKGTDYFTEEDKAEIVEAITAETNIDIIPDYVIAEAESVIDRVIAAQSNRTFTFAAITDMHYGNGSYTDGIKHACQAMKYIDERIKLDAVAVLGDYADSYPATEYENAIGDFKEINSVLADLRFAPNLRIQGNHDYYADHSALVHRFIQSHSDNVVWGDKAGGYFYRDFEDFKLRVICVNTTETGNANIGCSTAQFEWFVNSLDLTAKEDVAEWQILILSHHPLDWYCIDSTYRFCYILEGYKNGASGTAGGIAYDFTGKNFATLIGNIHGHIHNLLTDYINKGNINTSNPTAVMRMCTPEACINRANQYDGWKEDTTYSKTINTAQDTSFVIYCIDLDTYTINAICYGAGYGRTVEYSTGEIITTYKVTNNLTNVSSSNSAATAKTGESYTATLTATAGEITSVIVTMDGADITSTAYSNGVISIASVTGNIVITAVAEVPEVSYTNMLTRAVASDGSAYNGGQGWKTGYRLGSAGTESAQDGMEVTGFIPVTIADTIYFSGVTWALNSTLASKCYFHLYNSSFAKVTGQQLSTDLSTGGFTYDEAGNPVEINVQKFCNYTGTTAGDTIAYFRISAEEINANSIITVNEPIE